MKDSVKIPKDIDEMKWKQLMGELLKMNNCCIDVGHFVVQDLYHFINIQRNFIDQLVINGKDPSKDEGALFRKKKLKELLTASIDKENVHKTGYRPERFGSIYPLKNNPNEN